LHPSKEPRAVAGGQLTYLLNAKIKLKYLVHARIMWICFSARAREMEVARIRIAFGLHFLFIFHIRLR